MVTIIWLYLEILRPIAIAGTALTRRGNNRPAGGLSVFGPESAGR